MFKSHIERLKKSKFFFNLYYNFTCFSFFGDYTDFFTD